MKRNLFLMFLLTLILVFTVDNGLMANFNKSNSLYELLEANIHINKITEEIIQLEEMDTLLKDSVIKEIEVFKKENQEQKNSTIAEDKNLNFSSGSYNNLYQEIDNNEFSIMIEKNGYMVIYNTHKYFIPIEEIESADFCLDIFSDYRVLEEIKEILSGGI